jgi:hypothetical protein
MRTTTYISTEPGQYQVTQRQIRLLLQGHYMILVCLFNLKFEERPQVIWRMEGRGYTRTMAMLARE